MTYLLDANGLAALIALAKKNGLVLARFNAALPVHFPKSCKAIP